MPLPPTARPVAFILTADRSKTVPFYAEVLGLRLIAEEDFGVVFDLGGGATLRLTDIKDHAPGPHTVLGWEVPDIRSAMAELRAKACSSRFTKVLDRTKTGCGASRIPGSPGSTIPRATT